MVDWNARYRAGEFDSLPPLAQVERAAAEYPPGLALDLACGLGRHAIALAERGWQVTAVDSSEVAIGRLRNSARSRGLCIEARVRDLESSDFEIEAGRYDLICDCLYLWRPLIPRILAGVKPGGLAFLAIPMVDDNPGLRPMKREYLVQSGELAAWFSTWRILRNTEERESPEGRKLAQLLAQRPSNTI